uniref:Filamentous hemagglutinin N-terminal domain-containing protein n=1 Tax=Desmonostoc muscorum LEGE 12446 TaxID=1828758 RepID=A0A8J6ZS51_DESMC
MIFYLIKISVKFSIVILIGIALKNSDRAIAQVIPDNTLGTNVESLNPQIDQITGGSQRGANLFHSFSEFNVGAGKSVYFQNTNGVNNILTRVTGSNSSQIFGTLGVLGKANLFLLNPNGIIFGENARLDISGSFFASTAKSLVFENGLEFNTTKKEAPPLLTINIRPGLQTATNGNITNAGNLTVNTGENLTLFGNTVTSTGTITAPGGRVEIFGDRIGLLDNAKIDVSAVGGGGRVLIGGDFQGQGAVTNATRTFIGKNVTINADAIDRGNGGRVVVWSDGSTKFYGTVSDRGGVNSGNGGFVEISGKQSLEYKGLVDTSATNGNVGTLLLDPTNIEVVDVGGETFDLNDADAFSDSDLGDDGNTKVYADALNFSFTDVILQATENITFTAPVFTFFPGVGLSAEAGDSIFVNNEIISNGGQIQLNAGTGDLLINSQIASLGGDIFLNANNNILVNNQIINQGGQIQFNTDQGDIAINSNVFAFEGDLGINTKNLIITQGLVASDNTNSQTVINVKINASESINIIGENSSLISASRGSATGSNLEIDTGTLNIQNGGTIGLLTQSQETAGNLTINARNSINVNGSSISTQNINTQKGGNISIFTEKLLVQDTGSITTLGNGGKAGNLSIQASESIDVINQGTITSAAIQENGAAGDLEIDTKNLNLQNQALVTSSSVGSKNPSGKVTVRANNSVNIETSSQLSSTSIGFGNAGELNLFTGKLTISNSGGVTSQTIGTANAGNLNIYAVDSVNLVNGGIVSTSSFGTGGAGNLYIETKNLHVVDGNSLISTTSSDTGTIYQALQNSAESEIGKQILSLPTEIREFLFESLEAANQQSGTQGNSGNLTIRATESVNITNTGGISTSGTGKAFGGTLFIDTRQLNLQNQSNIFTNTLGSGNAGFLHIRATDALAVSGNSKIYTQAEPGSTGNGGNILLQTERLAITDRADVSSATLGKGRGGDIQIQTNSFLLTNSGRVNSISEGTGNAGNIFIDITDKLQANRGEIKATSIQAGGGDININARDIRLRNSSEITTSVFNGTGGGGNIDIQSEIFVALEDSDILANADAGTGGNITINSPVFVAQFFSSGRNPGDFAQFRGNGQVDISADSRLGESGEVVIKSIDPIRNLTSLPQIPVDSEIAEGCYSPTQTQSKFVVTGRGGLPTNPKDVLTSDAVQVDWVSLKPNPENRPTASINNQTTPESIVEAAGWIINAKGEVILTANVPTIKPDSYSQQPVICSR